MSAAEPLARPPANPGAHVDAAAVARFVDALSAESERAAASLGAERLRLVVGDVQVELRIADPTLLRLVERSMGHLRVAAVGPPDVRLEAFAGGRPPAPPWPLHPLRAKGEIGPEEPSAPVRAAFQADLPALHLYDRAAARGFAWYAAPERLPSWEHPHLLLRLLHFALADHGWYAVHGAVVERDGRGILLPGRSGTGKTTTAVAALAGGFDFLGDDHVLVRPGSPARAASLFATTRLTPRSQEMLATIGLSAPMASAATPPSDKALFYVADFPGVRLARTTRLEAIALPRPGGAAAIEPASAAAALRDLAPSTILFLPHAAAIGTFAALGRLVRELPAFRLPLGADLSEVGPALAAVLERATGASAP